MTKSNMRGYIGESFVQLELCKAGFSVNNLLFSDYGIDISVQLPLLDAKWNIPPGISSKSKKSWEMDLRFAHIQVKYSAKGSRKVDRDEVNCWVESSKTGVPTFLFIVTERNGGLASAYFDPADMKEIAHDTYPEEKVLFSYKHGRKFERSEAVISMVFWARYPLVAFKALPFNEDDTVVDVMLHAIKQRRFAIAHEHNKDMRDDLSGVAKDIIKELSEFLDKEDTASFDQEKFKTEFSFDSDPEMYGYNIANVPDHMNYNTEEVWWSYFFSSGSYEDALRGLKVLFEARS